MELRQLTTFLQVAQYKNFSRAADKLGYSQSAVTVQIQQLETELGVRLFDRIGRQVTLTARGTALVEYAYSILNQVEQVKEVMDQSLEVCPTLRIGTIESLCCSHFPTLLHNLRQLHPRLAVEISTGNPGDLLKKMEQGDIDLVYILDEPRYNNNWQRALEVQEEVVFVCTPSLSLTTRPNLRVTDLLKEPFFLTEKNVNYRHALDQYLASQSVSISPFLEAPNTNFIVQMLQTSEGISLLPRFAVEKELAEGTLAILDVIDFHIRMYRQIFYHRNKWKSSQMEDFIRLAKNPLCCELPKQ